MRRLQEVRIGFGGYAPYTIEGKGPGDVNGFAVDMITDIVHAADSSVRLTWIPTKFDRLILDFQTDKFDLVVEPLIQTLPRALQMGMSSPYTYIGYGIAVVRSQEQRFAAASEVDQESITVAVTSTASSHQYAERTIRKAAIRTLPAGSLDQPLLEVLAGRADVAFADEVTIVGFFAQHPGALQALSLDAPPEKLGAGFLFPQGDYEWASFLNAGIAYMQNTGRLRQLARKYKVPYYETPIIRAAPEQ